MPQDDDRHPNPKEKLVDAKALHQHVIEVEEKKALERVRERHLEDEHRRHAYFEFLSRKFTDEDLANIEEKTGDAVHAGQFEVEVMRFPAWYLTDHGRAINNAHENWPETLTGYAASFYAAYKDIGAPRGFKIKARVVDYPHGNIGDIALYLGW